MDKDNMKSLWAGYDKKKDIVILGFDLDDETKTVTLNPEEAVDVCWHIFSVMGWRRFFKQVLHNKFKR